MELIVTECLFVTGCLWIIIGIFVGIVASCTEFSPIPIIVVIIVGLGAFFVTKGLSNYNNNNSEYPTAMDVYQGKTTLKIIYEDGVAVDSVVVFKTIKND